MSRLDIMAMGLMICLICVLAWHLRGDMADDAFIYLHMADNVASGHGWAFNSGHPINAATSPFFLALLALAIFLHVPSIGACILITVLGLSTVGVVIYFATFDLGRLVAFLLAVTACTRPAFVVTTGMEPAIFLACIALTAFAFQRNQPILTGLFAGLAALGRPEGVAMLPLVLLAELLRERRISWKIIVAFLVTITPWIVFSLVEFHTIMPHTLRVKALQTGTGFWKGSYLQDFFQQLYAPKILAPFAIIGLVRMIMDFWRRPFLILVVSFGILQVVGYIILKAPSGYFWYDTTGNLVYGLAVTLGLLVVIRVITSWLPRSPGWLYDSGVVVLLIIYLGTVVIALRKEPPVYRLSAEYRSASDWIRQNSNQQDWIACNEVGYIGFYSDRKIRDMLGLLEPSSIGPLSQHRWDWWFTDFPEPRFIVVHRSRWIGEPGSVRFPWPPAPMETFQENYRKVYVAGKVEVFERQP